MIRGANADDADAIAAIYAPFVRDTIVTFEEQPPSPTEIARRLAEVALLRLPWLVAEQSGQVVGYAYATTWKTRASYRRTVESAIYVAPTSTRAGVGSRLYGELVTELSARGIHAILGGIALPNLASIGLHEKHGFVHVGTLREVGFKLDRWIDVGYWERVLG